MEPRQNEPTTPTNEAVPAGSQASLPEPQAFGIEQPNTPGVIVDSGPAVPQEQPPQTTQPMLAPELPGSGAVMPLTQTAAAPRNRKKVLLFSVTGLVVLLLGSSAAAYFGYLVPNNPTNIWSAALTRTADGYDRLVQYTADRKDMNSGTVKGNIKLEGDLATDGTFDGKFSKGNAEFTGDLGILTSRITADVRAIDAANSGSPDLYVKVGGLKGLGAVAGPYGAIAEKFDNQWIVIDHSFLDTVASNAAKSNGSLSGINSLTPADLQEVGKAVGEVNRKYIFTTDSSTAVLKVAQSVGKEQQDGRSVYHYKVALDKQHTKDYLQALATRLDQTPVKKMLDGKTVKEAAGLDEFLKEVDKYDPSNTADVYVDTGTKLLRTIRIADTANSKSYVELGLHITDETTVPFIATIHTDENGDVTDMTAKLTQNLKTNVTDLALNFDTKNAESREKGTATMTITPGTESVKVEKPAGAKSLNEVMGALGLSGLTNANALSSCANETELSAQCASMLGLTGI